MAFQAGRQVRRPLLDFRPRVQARGAPPRRAGCSPCLYVPVHRAVIPPDLGWLQSPVASIRLVDPLQPSVTCEFPWFPGRGPYAHARVGKARTAVSQRLRGAIGGRSRLRASSTLCRGSRRPGGRLRPSSRRGRRASVASCRSTRGRRPLLHAHPPGGRQQGHAGARLSCRLS